MRPYVAVMLHHMWIQAGGVLWGTVGGVCVGYLARRVAAGLLGPCGDRLVWCDVAGAACLGVIGWWAASHRVTGTELAAIVGLILLIWWSLTAAVADVTLRRLPNLLTLFGFVAVLVYGALVGRPTVAVLGAVLLGGIYAIACLCAPGSLGAGDAKLAWGLGGAAALGGGQCWLLAAAIAPILTAAVGVVLVCRCGRSARNSALPHGASMCAATVFALAVTLG